MVTQEELRSVQQGFRYAQQNRMFSSRERQRTSQEPTQQKVQSSVENVPEKPVVTASFLGNDELIGLLNTNDRSLIAAELRGQAEAANEKLKLRENRNDIRLRHIRDYSEKAAKVIEEGVGVLNNNERVAAGRARAPDMRITDLRNRYATGDLQRRAIISSAELEDTKQQMKEEGFIGTPTEFVAQQRASLAAQNKALAQQKSFEYQVSKLPRAPTGVFIGGKGEQAIVTPVGVKRTTAGALIKNLEGGVFEPQKSYKETRVVKDVSGRNNVPGGITNNIISNIVGSKVVVEDEGEVEKRGVIRRAAESYFSGLISPIKGFAKIENRFLRKTGEGKTPFSFIKGYDAYGEKVKKQFYVEKNKPILGDQDVKNALGVTALGVGTLFAPEATIPYVTRGFLVYGTGKFLTNPSPEQFGESLLYATPYIGEKVMVGVPKVAEFVKVKNYERVLNKKLSGQLVTTAGEYVRVGEVPRGDFARAVDENLFRARSVEKKIDVLRAKEKVLVGELEKARGLQKDFMSARNGEVPSVEVLSLPEGKTSGVLVRFKSEKDVLLAQEIGARNVRLKGAVEVSGDLRPKLRSEWRTNRKVISLEREQIPGVRARIKALEGQRDMFFSRAESLKKNPLAYEPVYKFSFSDRSLQPVSKELSVEFLGRDIEKDVYFFRGEKRPGKAGVVEIRGERVFGEERLVKPEEIVGDKDNFLVKAVVERRGVVSEVSGVPTRLPAKREGIVVREDLFGLMSGRKVQAREPRGLDIGVMREGEIGGGVNQQLLSGTAEVTYSPIELSKSVDLMVLKKSGGKNGAGLKRISFDPLKIEGGKTAQIERVVPFSEEPGELVGFRVGDFFGAQKGRASLSGSVSSGKVEVVEFTEFRKFQRGTKGILGRESVRSVVLSPEQAGEIASFVSGVRRRPVVITKVRVKPSKVVEKSVVVGKEGGISEVSGGDGQTLLLKSKGVKKEKQKSEVVGARVLGGLSAEQKRGGGGEQASVFEREKVFRVLGERSSVGKRLGSVVVGKNMFLVTPKYDFSSSQKSTQVTSFDMGQKQIQKIVPDSAERVGQKTSPDAARILARVTDTAGRSVQRTRSDTMQKPIQRFIQKVRGSTKIKEKPVSGLLEEVSKTDEERGVGVLLVPGYKVELKRRGKFFRVAGGLSRVAALRVGSEAARSTLGATFRIEKTGGFVKPSKESVDLSGFRDYKVVRGKRVKLQDEYIQLRSKRLSSVGERKEILGERKRVRGRWLG